MSEPKWPLPDKVYCYSDRRSKAVRTSRSPTSFPSIAFVKESELRKVKARLEIAEKALEFYKNSGVKDDHGDRPFDGDLGLKAMEYFNGT